MLRIVYANLGYSRGIDGSLGHHLRRAHRHLYTPRHIQLRSLHFVRDRLRELRPDLSCFAEIDRGSTTNGFFDQLPPLVEHHHALARIDNKYSADRRFRSLSVSRGKSNAFLATSQVRFEARYLSFGKKRLVHDIALAGVRVLAAHLSLRHRVRALQMAELKRWIDEDDRPTVVLGDFNLFRGVGELAPLLRDGRLVHCNAASGATFRLGPYRAALDVCLVSRDLAGQCTVTILDQPFSDHQMIQLDIAGIEAADARAPAILVADEAA